MAMITRPDIPRATGASLCPEAFRRERLFPVTAFGASPESSPEVNTRGINNAILAASREGGTVFVPKGTFRTYTICLKSNINLCLEKGAVIAAAKTDIVHSHEKQSGEGGNYLEPEVNPYAGLQDHGHSYFANSLVYGADLENIMICGEGLFTGGRTDPETGIPEYVLQGADPSEPENREAPGHRGEWFGNKGIALVRCRNIILRDFSFTIGGHFAVIAQGCENLYVQHILIDTTRDAFDIDCCRNVTVRNTVCNSLTDDGLCLKASFGAGSFRPLENVLIEDCTVSGFDAGSVYAGEYTKDKLAAADRCGPTGRVKFGTEGTCGYRLVTIRRVTFQRSRGFCMEAVDGSSLTDVIFEDCTLDNVSSSPIFIRAGDRGRFPVTGSSPSLEYPPSGENVRLDNKNWILPNDRAYHCYPARRYAPHYNRTRTVTVDGHSFFEVVDETCPAECNPANYEEREGRFYLKVWKEGARDAISQNPEGRLPHGYYTAEESGELAESDLPLYANGMGCARMAFVSNVLIRNITVTNADPRYPILLMGLTDSHIKNITLENISVEYRGGLSMEHATEQRQLNTEWKYSQFGAKEQVQNLPWLVNSFFLKNEGLLPRADWDSEKNCWKDDPYNVPELPDGYPEPSCWGILPAYGLYARHADGLTLRNIRFSCKVPDGRHVCVFDDVKEVTVQGMEAFCREDILPVAAVTHHYRRHTNAEYVPEQPYFTTKVTGLSFLSPPILHRDASGIPSSRQKIVEDIVINAPAPGTPRDSLYTRPTVPCAETGYRFPIATREYPLPLTVHRPFIRPVAPVRISPGEAFSLTLSVRNPAGEVSEEADDGIVYNEQTARKNYSVGGIRIPLTLSCGRLPEGGTFDPAGGIFRWTPAPCQTGEYEIYFYVDDGVIPEEMSVKILVGDF